MKENGKTTENIRIIEKGNHQELLKLNGKYAGLHKYNQK